MSSNTGWTFGQTPAKGSYSNAQFYSPSRSARLGILNAADNVNSYSSMQQTVSVPLGDKLYLQLYAYPLSQPYDPGDMQEVLILNAAGNTVLKTLWSATSNTAAWTPLQFDISEYIGQTITVYLNVRNNGAGGVTSMFADDVVLNLCNNVTATVTSTPIFVTATPTPTTGFITATPTPIVVTNTPTPTTGPIIVTATPTPWIVTNTPTPTTGPIIVTATPTSWIVTNTPTPTAGPIVVTATPTNIVVIVTNTPTPSIYTPTITPTYTPVTPLPEGDCKECLLNVNFESWNGWHFGKTPLEGGYSGEQYYSAVRSAALGNVNPAAPNYNSYSSVRQRVDLPKKGISTAYLEFWNYTISSDSNDYQELVILDAYSGRTLDVLWRVSRNDQSWQYERFDMTRYLGKSILVYFNVYNDGYNGSAAMYVDNASLKICPRATPTPGAIPPPAVTPTPTPADNVIIVTATATPETSVTPTPTATATLIPGEVGTLSPDEIAALITPTMTLTPPVILPLETTLPDGVVIAPELPFVPTPTPEPRTGLINRIGSTVRGNPVACFLFIVVLVAIIILIVLLVRALMARRKQAQENEEQQFPPST